jgi:hypothetical protein
MNEGIYLGNMTQSLDYFPGDGPKQVPISLHYTGSSPKLL